ncbi:MAG: TonB-dependent receptor [Terracidiphilus sp.]|jgi:outer membrane receptor protein involved in Fe transport
MTQIRIRLGILCLTLLVLGLCSGAVALRAQTTTEGAIAGTVLDPSGATVANAAVTIHNVATDAEVKLTADSSGYFKAPLLEPGTYTVTLSATGFAGYRADGVLVQVGQVTSLEPRLALASASASVEVTEQAPVLNMDSPDVSASLNERAMETIPINNRRWSSLAMTTPGIVADTNGFGLISVRGISTILNNVEIDGADDNQAYYAEERGRTREAYSTSGSAVREFAVNTGVYSAEYGRAAGGVVTSVTKSGSNQLHAQLYFYQRESKWNAYNDFAKLTSLNPTTNTYVAAPIKPEDMRKIYGFTAGGAILKDRLFWIYTYDQHSRINPIVGVPNSPSSFYTLPAATLPSGAVCNPNGYLSGDTTSTATQDGYACTLAARQSTTYATGASLYSTGIAALNTDIGTTPHAGYQEINTPKLDWQVNQKEHVSFLYHRLRWDSPGGVQTQSTDHYAFDTQGNDFVKLDYGVAKLTSLITSSISNELLYQYGRELNDEGQQPFSAYTKQYLFGNNGAVATGGGFSPNVPEVAVATSTSGFYIGSPYYSYRKALPDERKWQIGDILYYTKGNHSFKFGTDNVHNSDLLNNTYESNGYISYTYLGNYINDVLNEGKPNSTCNSSASATPSSATAVATGTYPCYSSLTQGFGPPEFAITTTDYAFFGQDNWKITPRLSLELGLRWDYEKLPPPFSNLITATGNFVPYAGLSNTPSDKTNFGPRIGFAYDLLGGGNTVLHGGYGIYYGRITNGNLLNVLYQTGSPNGQYTTTFKPAAQGATPAGPQFPNIVAGTGAAGTPSSFFLAPNLRNPGVQEFTLSVQHQMPHGTVGELSYLGGLGRELPNFLNLNLNPATVENVTITISDSSGAGPIPNGTQFVVPTYTSYGNTGLFGSAATSFTSITEMTSNINSSYNAMAFEVLNRSLKSLQFDVNYTWSHSLDFAQQASTTTSTNNWYDPFSNARANYGNSQWDIPNRLVGYALWKLPNVKTQSFLKYIANDWSFDNSFQIQDGLPFTLATSSYNSSAAEGTGWNGSGASAFIPSIGIDNKRIRRKMVDDIRLQKEVSLKERYHLELMANMFNAANHQNFDGINSTGYVLSSGSTSTTGTATYQSATYGAFTSSNSSGFLYTPRQIEIAARLSF